MLAFAQAGKGELLQVTKDQTESNVSAYATRNDDGKFWVIVINKNLSQDINAEIGVPKVNSSAMAFWLRAPSVNSLDEVTLAGTRVAESGSWTGGTPEVIDVQKGMMGLLVPRGSAVLLRL